MAFLNVSAVPSCAFAPAFAPHAGASPIVPDSFPCVPRYSDDISHFRLTLSLDFSVPRPLFLNARVHLRASTDNPLPSLPLGFHAETFVLELNGSSAPFSIPSRHIDFVVNRPFSVFPTEVLSVSSLRTPSRLFALLCDFFLYCSKPGPCVEIASFSTPPPCLVSNCVAQIPTHAEMESIRFPTKTLPAGRLLQFHKRKYTKRPETLIIHESGLALKTSALGVTSKPNSRPITVKSASGEKYEAYEISRKDFERSRRRQQTPRVRSHKPRKINKAVEPFFFPEEPKKDKRKRASLPTKDEGFITFGTLRFPLSETPKEEPRLPKFREVEIPVVKKHAVPAVVSKPVRTFRPVATTGAEYVNARTQCSRRPRNHPILRSASYTFGFKKMPLQRFMKEKKDYYVKRSKVVSSCSVTKSPLEALTSILKNLPRYSYNSERLKFYDHFIGDDFEIEVHPLRGGKLSVLLILPKGEAYCVVTAATPQYHAALTIARGDRPRVGELLQYRPGEGLCYLAHAALCCALQKRTFREEDFFVGMYPTKFVFAKRLTEKLGPSALKHPVRGRQVSRSLFHCDVASAFSSPFYSLPRFIGGVEEEAPEITSSLKHKAIESVYERVSIHKDNLLARSVEKDLIDFKDEIKSLSKEKRSVTVPFYMGEAVQSGLTRAYPQFNLSFTHSVYSDHPAAAGSRLLENETLASMAKSSFSDIGGCPLFHIKRGSTDYHVCRPIYDMKDAQRRVSRELQARGLVENLSREQLVEAQARVSVCPHTLGNCNVKSDVLIMVQVYDASLNEIASAMVLKESKVAYLTMVTPGELLDEREAFAIDALGCDVVVDTRRDMVQYKFGSSCYCHKLSNIKNIMLTPAFTFSGNLFSVEMYENRMGVNYYKITRSAYSPEIRGVKTLRYRRACTEVVQVKLPRFDKTLKTFLSGYDYIYLDAKFVSRVFDYVVSNCSVVNSKTFEWVWSYIKSSKSRVVISGKVIHRDVHIDLKHSECFAAVMLAVGVRSRTTTEFLAKNLNYYTGDASCFETIRFLFREWSRRAYAEINRSFRKLMKSILSAGLDYEFLDLDNSLQHLLEYSEVEVRVSIAQNGEVDCNEENRVLTEIIAEAADRKSIAQGLSGALSSVPTQPRGGLRGGSRRSGVSFLYNLVEEVGNLFFSVGDAVRFLVKVFKTFSDSPIFRVVRMFLDLAEAASPFVSVVSLCAWLREAVSAFSSWVADRTVSESVKTFVNRTVKRFLNFMSAKTLTKKFFRFFLSASALAKTVVRKAKVILEAYWEVWFESILSDSGEYSAVEFCSSVVITLLTNSGRLLPGFSPSAVITEVLLDLATKISIEVLLKQISPVDSTASSALYRRVLSEILSNFRTMGEHGIFTKVFLLCGFLPVFVRKCVALCVPGDMATYARFLEYGVDDLFFLGRSVNSIKNYLCVVAAGLVDSIVDSVVLKLSGVAKERVLGFKSKIIKNFLNVFRKAKVVTRTSSSTDLSEDEYFSCDESKPGLRGGSSRFTLSRLLDIFFNFLKSSKLVIENACFSAYERIERNMKLYFFPLNSSEEEARRLIRCAGDFDYLSDSAFDEDEMLRQAFEQYYSSDDESVTYDGKPTVLRSYLNVSRRFLETFCNGPKFFVKVSNYFKALYSRLLRVLPWVDRNLSDSPGLKGGNEKALLAKFLKTCVITACECVSQICCLRLIRLCWGTPACGLVRLFYITYSGTRVLSRVVVAVAVCPLLVRNELDGLSDGLTNMGVSVFRRLFVALRRALSAYSNSALRRKIFEFIFGNIHHPFDVAVIETNEVAPEPLSPEVDIDVDCDFGSDSESVSSDEVASIPRPGLHGGSRRSSNFLTSLVKVVFKLAGRIPRLLFRLRNFVAYFVERRLASKRLKTFIGLARLFDNFSLTSVVYLLQEYDSVLNAFIDVELVLLNSGSVNVLPLVSWVRGSLTKLAEVIVGSGFASFLGRMCCRVSDWCSSSSNAGCNFMSPVRTKGKFVPPSSSGSTASMYERLEALESDIREHVLSTCRVGSDEEEERPKEVTEPGIEHTSEDVVPIRSHSQPLSGGECSYSEDREENERANLLPHVSKIVSERRGLETARRNKRTLRGVSEFLNAINTSNEQPRPIIVDHSPESRALTNSVREFYYLQELALFELSCKLREYYDQLKVANFNRQECLCDKDEDMFVLRAGQGVVSGRNSRLPLKHFKGHEFCFRSGGLVPYDGTSRVDTIFHTQTNFVSANALLSGYLSYRTFTFTNLSANVLLYEAPPGGGKTTTLIKVFCETFSKVNSLILTANKSSREEILAKVNRIVLDEGDTPLQTRDRILTIDSYLMNNRGLTCKVLYLDECFMVHAGAAVACIEFTKCDSAILFGDSRQIHYIDRNELDTAVLSDLNRFVDDESRVYGEVSYRCPWDVCAWLSTFYPKTVATTNLVSAGQSSMQVREIESVDDVEYSSEFVYLTMLQSEKKDLLKSFGKRSRSSVEKPTVLTVHEAQGETYRKVNLVRTKFQEDDPFRSENHITVALSRHVESLTYSVLSSKRDDAIAQAIVKAKQLVDAYRVYPTSFGGSTLDISVNPSTSDRSKCKASSAPYEVINSFLESVVPGTTSVDFGDVSEEMGTQVFESGADNVVIRDSAPVNKSTDHDPQRVSSIRSQAIPKRKPSLQENLYSYESRNYNFTVCERFSGPQEFGQAMAMVMLERSFDLEKVAKVRSDVIAITEKGVRTWMSKREPSQLRALSSDLQKPLNLEEEITTFKLMVKRDAKVKLDSSCLVKHPPAQNIMFHRKAVNAIFSPCFDEFKNRVITCTNSNIVFFTEMTNSTLASIAKEMLGSEHVYNVGEIDFSKFDKSQDAFIKSFERTLYSAFGFDEDLLDVWMQGEYTSNATTLDGQLSFSVDNQRKSGASNTWIGNSIVTLGILSMFYYTNRFKALFVSGDDSLIFSESPIRNSADAMCTELGFETKFLTPSVPYFCSKFFVMTGHDVFFVPDPYKLLVKLGASKDEVDDEFLFEVFTSFRDLTKDLVDERVIELLTHLVHSKYGYESGDTYAALCAIHCIRSNFSSFKKLYPKVKGWVVHYGKLKFVLRKFANCFREKFDTAFGEAYFLTYDET
uniref:p348 n=1 Tax=Beet yellows virus TaxID=12161 RepID=Q9Q703_9CLOS|nr:p348 [Beet yellows virus]